MMEQMTRAELMGNYQSDNVADGYEIMIEIKSLHMIFIRDLPLTSLFRRSNHQTQACFQFF